MNRAERRREKRNSEKKVTLSNAEIEKIKRNTADSTFDTILALLYVLPLQILRNQGWGKVRLQRFNDDLTDLINSTDFKRENVQSLVEKMKNDYGITFKNQGV
ncbi:hypothetical protein [Peptostreptococcus sp. D1]|uniref:hypothetical protein n=1 Tax=Peptostreptococcus sp. D1 TaxID=72304 RepID=UPI0008DFE3EB|nr:hypothetical protein [Peptostreptococcus sp. D1]SFE89661.1 hypothetical protein SAMN02910278_01993 [Peptostreptococcus sp. D1]